MNQEEFEDTKGTIRNRISKKNRQHNGQQSDTTRCRGMKLSSSKILKRMLTSFEFFSVNGNLLEKRHN
jgi:hypothetical protein